MAGNHLWKRAFAVFLSTCMIAATLPSGVPHINAVTDKSADDYEEIVGAYSIDKDAMTYKDYLAALSDTKRPQKEYVIDAGTYVRTEGMDDLKTLKDYEGMQGESVYTTESGLIEWEVDVEESGLYDLSVLYYPVEGKNSSMQRSLFVDGELPYSELSMLNFSRIWVNESDKWEKDNQGNDLKPRQKEAPAWINTKIYDSVGYITDPLAVYLEAGKHTLTFVSHREPMLIRSLTLSNTEDVAPYEKVAESYESSGAKDYDGDAIVIEAEDADRKSSKMLYPQQDSNSPEVEPYSARYLLNNTIGGNSWRLIGDWIEWDFDAPKDGLYSISLHDKQSFVKGTYVSRKISIDGEVPFEELEDYGFTYQQSWRLDTIEDEEGNAYKFYLTKGKHTLRMEVVLGDFSDIVGQVQSVVADLNAIYRQVIRITGVAPDSYRDYQIEESLPGLEDDLKKVKANLDKVIKDLQTVAGKGSDKESVLITMRDQLEDLIKDQERFTKILASFKTNVRATGNWISDVMGQPFALDAIYIHAPEEKISTKGSGVFDKVAHEVKKLYYSFKVDYNQIGNVADEDEDAANKTLTLWVGSGRDQANVIKSLVDESFTNQKGINVNVMLVDMNTLLQATLAGQGPDIAIQVNGSGATIQYTTTTTYTSNSIPINYGIRNAVVDLSQFDDLEEVEGRFFDSAMTSFRYNGATYALPETETFLMMFYRKDILKELNMEIPKTWDEMKVALAILSKNQMDLGMLPSEEAFSMFLYQYGGSYYNENGTICTLDSDEAVDAFKEYCEYYTDYTLDQETSVEERFRTGESPIIIADYTTYNNLAVSAPDIAGLWGMAPVPGVMKEDGSIENTQGCVGSACMIMEACEEKEAAWEFLKWWTSADVQTAYDNEMEGLMGSAARVATANKEAFANLPWTHEEYTNLLSQAENVQGIPQVPGSYYTYRNVNNAFYSVVTEKDTTTPRESLMDKVLVINSEIRYKLEEFNLLHLLEEANEMKE